MTVVASRTGAGPLVKEWRQRRGRSQMDLANDVGVSPRHLSFVETGRSKPSPELLLTLSEALQVPLRERNTLLLAAGYAPRYAQTPLGDPSMDRVRESLQHLLDSHAPYPGCVIDRLWNSVLSNEPAWRIVDGLPDELIGPPTNIFRVSLHPDGLAPRTLNFPEWSAYLLAQLHRLVVLTADPDVAELEQEVTAYPNIAEREGRHHQQPSDEPALLIPWRLEVCGVIHSYFTTLTSFGTPQDITLSELAIELFYPADPETEASLRAAHGAAPRERP
ncbi:MAG TPA: helix-turn-helix transcriptional regulator [Acidimicrobiia bacterium]